MPFGVIKMKVFDQILWRINGLLILGATLLIGVLGLYAIYEIFKDKTRDRNVWNVVTVNEETIEEENLGLGNFSKIDGTGYFLAPLVSNESIHRGAYSKASSSTRNYLFYSSAEGSSHWLFSENTYLIVDREELSKELEEGSQRSVIGHLYTVVQSDSNGDSLLTHLDEKTLYISGESGTDLTPIVEEVISLLGIHQVTDQRVFLFIHAADGDFVYHLDIPTHKILEKHEIRIEG